ncbi:uncharacterized protein LOC129714410 [Leucoraja erinacea]|uniref:uncharacterized protein LOC129714410 n=1 Tax=Leucoraja erinaceus TaxID=7782 RepID=UPI0024582E64|nr:uncharacterized protein LOC129714410 [Leucoraja erinacea]
MLQRIASIPLNTGAFDMTFYSILITLMELGNSGNQEHGSPMTDKELQLLEALMQLHRFLHGSASQIWKLLSLTQTICSLLDSEDTQVSCREVYTILAEKCRKLISDFLDSDYRKVSSDFVTLSRRWKRELETSLCVLLEGPHRKLINNFKVVLCIGTVMLIQAVEHSLPWTPVLTHMKAQAEEGSRGTIPGNNQVYSEYPPHGVTKLPVNGAQSIDVAGNVSNGQHDEHNTALLKFCVDCRLDWHWEQCLQAIFSESPLPPNPYPIVASEFIKASLRMDLWQMGDEDILRQILQCAPELVDHENHIFQVPGIPAFGFKTALSTLNPDTFQSILGVTSLLGNSSFPHRYQDFKVALCLGVNTSTTWLGSLSPFLTVLELTEFYYLKGPPGCYREALQAYAQLVQGHLKEVLGKVKGMLTFRVQLSEGQHWSESDILTYQSAFIEAFADSAARGQQIYLKVSIGDGLRRKMPASPPWLLTDLK